MAMQSTCTAGARFREEMAQLSWPWQEGPREPEHGGEVVEPSTFVATLEPPTRDPRARIRVLVDNSDLEVWIGGRLRRAFAADSSGIQQALQLIRDFCDERSIVALQRRSAFREVLGWLLAAFAPRTPRQWQPIIMRPRRLLGGLITGSEVLVPTLLRPGRSASSLSQVSWLGTHSTPGVNGWPA